MAIATLAEVYNNPEVFRGVVKIRKGLACRMILESGDLDGIFAWFHKLAGVIASRIPPSDPCASRTAAACKTAMELTNPAGKTRRSVTRTVIFASVPAVLLAGAYFYRRYDSSGLYEVNSNGTERAKNVCYVRVNCALPHELQSFVALRLRFGTVGGFYIGRAFSFFLFA